MAEEDIAVEEFKLDVPEYADPDGPSRACAPWHRPRKQYVREKCWLAPTKDLLAGVQVDEGLRYLGLPGTDLLDIRYFLDELCTDGRKMRFVGFNNAATGSSPEATELSLALSEVHLRDAQVDAQSRIVSDDIRMVGSLNTIAHDAVSEAAPYDVINLDLTQSIGADPLTAKPSMYDAVQNILQLQIGRTRPWMLLLTSTLDQPTFSPDSVQHFRREFDRLLEDCPHLEELCADLFGLTTDALDNDPDGNVFVYMAAVAVCRWLQHCAGRGPFWRMNLRAAFVYELDWDPDAYGMVHLSVKCTPTYATGVDPSGLAKGQPVHDVCEDAEQIIKKLEKVVNVDAKVRSDEALRRRLNSRTLELLGPRFESIFDDWVKDFES